MDLDRSENVDQEVVEDVDQEVMEDVDQEVVEDADEELERPVDDQGPRPLVINQLAVNTTVVRTDAWRLLDGDFAQGIEDLYKKFENLEKSFATAAQSHANALQQIVGLQARQERSTASWTRGTDTLWQRVISNEVLFQAQFSQIQALWREVRRSSRNNPPQMRQALPDIDPLSLRQEGPLSTTGAARGDDRYDERLATIEGDVKSLRKDFDTQQSAHGTRFLDLEDEQKAVKAQIHTLPRKVGKSRTQRRRQEREQQAANTLINKLRRGQKELRNRTLHLEQHLHHEQQPVTASGQEDPMNQQVEDEQMTTPPLRPESQLQAADTLTSDLGRSQEDLPSQNLEAEQIRQALLHLHSEQEADKARRQAELRTRAQQEEWISRGLVHLASEQEIARARSQTIWIRQDELHGRVMEQEQISIRLVQDGREIFQRHEEELRRLRSQVQAVQDGLKSHRSEVKSEMTSVGVTHQKEIGILAGRIEGAINNAKRMNDVIQGIQSQGPLPRVQRRDPTREPSIPSGTTATPAVLTRRVLPTRPASPGSQGNCRSAAAGSPPGIQVCVQSEHNKIVNHLHVHGGRRVQGGRIAVSENEHDSTCTRTSSQRRTTQRHSTPRSRFLKLCAVNDENIWCSNSAQLAPWEPEDPGNWYCLKHVSLHRQQGRKADPMR
ncbi:MAG: hypothetical protein Q9219_005294 [cf. Caloplaca sp. 3 TL-2023]